VAAANKEIKQYDRTQRLAGHRIIFKKLQQVNDDEKNQ
jgi:hypothetical protein